MSSTHAKVKGQNLDLKHGFGQPQQAGGKKHHGHSLYCSLDQEMHQGVFMARSCVWRDQEKSEEAEDDGLESAP